MTLSQGTSSYSSQITGLASFAYSFSYLVLNPNPMLELPTRQLPNGMTIPLTTTTPQ